MSRKPVPMQSPELDAGVTRAKTYVSGSDTGVLTAFYVSSINEWHIRQERVLVLTKTAYYRTTYDPKKGKIDHYHKTPLDEVRAIEKTANGVKIYLTKQASVSPVEMRTWTCCVYFHMSMVMYLRA